MAKAELAAAIRARRGGSRTQEFIGALRFDLTRAYRRLAALQDGRFALAFLRPSKPVSVLLLSLAALAAGALGLIAAYAISPNESSGGQVLVTNGRTLRITTVTGPGGTRTVAITKTKEGKTKLVPVRILRSVTGPRGTESVSVAVLSPPITVTNRQPLTVTDVVTVKEVETQVVTVNKKETKTVTETVVVTETVTNP
jgi:hypothetical protein